jgi:hypothetical protein
MKKVFVILGIIVLVIGGYLLLKKTKPISTSLGGGADVSSFVVLAGSKNATTFALTPIWFATSTGSNATSTKIIQIGSTIDTVDVNACITASSTSSGLQWLYDFSNDGINWFNQDITSVAGGTITHGAASTTNEWIPATTLPSCKNFTLTDFNADFLRITFLRKPGSHLPNFSLYAEGLFTDKQ